MTTDMNTITFDIETGPAAPDVLAKLMPAFEPDQRLSDPAKVQASIDKKKQEWVEKAALHAETAVVLAIGLIRENDELVVLADDEATILKGWWKIVESADPRTLFVGHNIYNFDLPLLIRRSYVHGIKVPSRAMPSPRYFPAMWKDTMAAWMLGTQDRISLDNLAKCLGVGSKSGSGKDFAALYKADPAAALQYLRNDLELTRACASRMGII